MLCWTCRLASLHFHRQPSVSLPQLRHSNLTLKASAARIPGVDTGHCCLAFKYLKDVPVIHFGRCRASTPEGPWAQPSQTIHPALPGSFPLHQQAEQGRSPWQKQVGKHRLWGLLGVQGHCHGQQGHQQKAVAALWGFLTLFRTVCLSGLLQCAWSLPAKMLSYFHRQKIADYLRKGGGILFPTEKNKLTFHMLHFWKLSQQLELLFLLWRKYSNRGRLHIPPYSPPLLL